MAVKWKLICKIVKRFLDEQIEGSKTLHIIACHDKPLVWVPPGVRDQTGEGHFATAEACQEAIAWLRRLTPTGIVDIQVSPTNLIALQNIAPRLG